MHQVDRRICDPHFDTPFLSWYEGIFEAVYIALHPFVEIEGLHPNSAPARQICVNRNDLPEELLTLDVVKDFSAEAQSSSAIDMETFDRLEKERGVCIAWETIRVACSFSSLAQVNRALLTIFLAVKDEFTTPEKAQRLEAYCDSMNIFLPTGDSIPIVWEKKMCSLFERLGCENVLISDEFNSNIESRSRIQLDTEKPWGGADFPRFRFSKIYPENHSFLVVAPFDSFYTAICGSRIQLLDARVDELFEGFWCDTNSKPDWWRDCE